MLISSTQKSADSRIDHSPIFGTLFFIWGAMSIIISSISYLFDAYPPRATLSALTAAASFRLSLAAIIPLVIIQSKHSTPGP